MTRTSGVLFASDLAAALSFYLSIGIERREFWRENRRDEHFSTRPRHPLSLAWGKTRGRREVER